MNHDDIEQLLQQYGEDRRQQIAAEGRVRRMARRAARIRRGAACLLLLLIGGGAAWHLLRPRQEQPLVAEAAQPDNRQEALQPDTTTLPDTPPHAESPARRTAPAETRQLMARAPRQTRTNAPQRPAEAAAAQDTAPVAAEPAAPLLAQDRPAAPAPQDNPDTPAVQKPQAVPADLLMPRHSMADELLALDQSGKPASERKPRRSRFRFTAGVGAAMAADASGSACTLSVGPVDVAIGDEPPLTDMACTYTPAAAFSAQAGMSCTLLQGERRHFDIGLGLGGCVQQCQMEMKGTSLAGDPVLLDRQQETRLGLYLNLPLTYSIHHRGPARTGWQLSLTPGRRVDPDLGSAGLATTRHQQAADPMALNPWRLSLGLGVALPRRWLHSVSLTADLLPVYQHMSVRQFGIVFEY